MPYYTCYVDEGIRFHDIVMKNKKSPGLDRIRNEMFKSGAFILAPCLAKLFNNILLSGKLPSCWRMSTLSIIHKQGD